MRFRWYWHLLVSAAAAAGSGLTLTLFGNPPATVQTPAVAGSFYSADPKVLSADLDALLKQVEARPIRNLRALVCPHAGYSFSGLTAAHGYRQLAGRDFSTVIVMGPSHYAAFQGAAVLDAGSYRTPLGDLKIALLAQELGTLRPFVARPRCQVQRPGWGRESAGPATPFTWEHSVEVQLPFLQKTLPEASVVPIVFGDVNPREVARSLVSHLDGRTLIIASSDLSHFHPYDVARHLDGTCVKAICDLDIAAMERQEACGKGPILALMHMAKQKGWKTKLLDARNSGDMGTPRDSVVGYAAIAFFEPEKNEIKHSLNLGETVPRLSAQEQKILLDLARRALTSAAQGGAPPKGDAAHYSSPLLEKRGCFVTLTKKGVLRGCIGHIFPAMALHEAVVENARSAALMDPRFPPVGPRELSRIRIEVSVLTRPEPLAFSSPEDLLRKLHPNQDGVVLSLGSCEATFLPQVWNQLPGKEAFLSELSLKAGGSATMWRQPGVQVQIYHVEAFHEPER